MYYSNSALHATFWSSGITATVSYNSQWVVTVKKKIKLHMQLVHI